MRNARLDEAQAGIKIVGRNINNLRYADETTLMPENKEELKSLLIIARTWKQPKCTLTDEWVLEFRRVLFRSPFLIWNQSVVPCPVLAVAS